MEFIEVTEKPDWLPRGSEVVALGMTQEEREEQTEMVRQYAIERDKEKAAKKQGKEDKTSSSSKNPLP